MSKQIRNWTYHEGLALIKVFNDWKGEYFKTRSKKQFWENVLEDLEATGELVGPATIEHIEVKWKSLIRAYKVVKEKGSTATKFLYMKEMEEILQSPKFLEATKIIKTDSSNSKGDFHERLLEEKRKKREMLERHFKEKEQAKDERHREMMDFLQLIASKLTDIVATEATTSGEAW